MGKVGMIAGLVGLALPMVAAADEAATSWTLIAFNGATPASEITLELDADGVSGRGPCNGYRATVTREAGALTVGPILSTRMACPELDLEARFFAALEGVTQALEDPEYLLMAGGGTWMVFTPSAP
jgi:heat shock protein HslJ